MTVDKSELFEDIARIKEKIKMSEGKLDKYLIDLELAKDILDTGDLNDITVYRTMIVLADLENLIDLIAESGKEEKFSDFFES